jgi:hypothetical protein
VFAEAVRPVAKRQAPTLSLYVAQPVPTLREVFAFTDPSEYIIRCTFHGVTRRAKTLEEAIEQLDGAWCGTCATLR